MEVLNDEEEDLSVMQGAAQIGLKPPKFSGLIENFLQNDDPLVRVQSAVKILALLVSLAKEKSEKLTRYLHVDGYLHELLSMVSKPIFVILDSMKSKFGRKHDLKIEASSSVYTKPVTKCSSLGNIYELVEDKTESAVYKQWQMAPISIQKRKPVNPKSVVKMKKKSAKSAAARSNSRAQMWTVSAEIPRFSAIDDDNLEDDDLDRSDSPFSLPSSTTGVSTMNTEQQAQFETMQAQIAQLQSQLNMLLVQNTNNVTQNDTQSISTDRLPSIYSSSSSMDPSPEKFVPPPPAPPPPPADFLQNKRLQAISKEKKEPSSKPSAVVNTNKAFLKDIGNKNFQLRHVARSPNGTPIRSKEEPIRPWPTTLKRRISTGKENQDKISANSGEFIAMALQRKFANVRMSDNFNEEDDENGSNHSGWDEDNSFENIQCKNKC